MSTPDRRGEEQRAIGQLRHHLVVDGVEVTRNGARTEPVSLNAGGVPLGKEIDELGRGAGEDQGIRAQGPAVKLVESLLACQRSSRLIVEEDDEIGDDAQGWVCPAHRLLVAAVSPRQELGRPRSICGVTNTTSAERAANRKAASTCASTLTMG